MAIIRCTKKLLDELKIKPTGDIGLSDGIGNWHANILWIDRRKCVLFTNDQTFYSFLIPAMKKPEFQNFHEVFRLNLLKNMMSEGLSKKQFEHLFDAHKEIRIAKTNNRSVLGSMNELAFQVKFSVHNMGGLATTNLLELNHELNRIPMGAIDYKFSIDELQRRLQDI
ncbi:MAG: hypothetical protein GY845_20785 [Planctomycetes bacterium]|nr:hypothetical protein [Planctomycetota bacterium]